MMGRDVALPAWQWRSRSGLQVALGAVALGVVVAAWPFTSLGALTGLLLIAAVVAYPLALVGIMLLIGPADLSFLTGGDRNLLRDMGGLDMNGIRLLGVAGGLGIVALAWPHCRRVLFGRYALLYVVFLVFAALRTLAVSPDQLEGLRLLVKLAYPLLFMVVIAGSVRTQRHLDRLGDLLLVGAALIIFVVNPLLFLEGGGVVQDMFAGARARGVGVHPATFSLYLALIIVFTLGRLLSRRQLRYAVLLAGCAGWLMLTQTRTGMGAVMLAIGAMAVLSLIFQRNVRALAGALGVGLVLAVLVAPIVLERTFPSGMPTIGELLALRHEPLRIAEYVHMSGRELLWPVVYDAFTRSPLFGNGLGASTVVMLSNFAPEEGGIVHNEYLRLLCDTGLVGMGLFAAATTTWLVGGLRAAARRTHAAQEWALPAVGALVVWAVGSIFDNGLDYYSAVGQIVGTLAGGALVVGGLAGPQRGPGNEHDEAAGDAAPAAARVSAAAASG